MMPSQLIMVVVVLLLLPTTVIAFSLLPKTTTRQCHHTISSLISPPVVPFNQRLLLLLQSSLSNDDDDDEFSDDGIFSTLQNKQNDLSGCQNRQFRLGYDLILSDYAGSMGFDQITDWDYFEKDDSSSSKKTIVEPSPLNPLTPKRTRSTTPSIIRLYRGELIGTIGAILRSQGRDNRVLIKEYHGVPALDLGQRELNVISRLQSRLWEEYHETNGSSSSSPSAAITAAERYLNGKNSSPTSTTRSDDANLSHLLHLLSSSPSIAAAAAPYVGILGSLNLDDYYSDPLSDPNEWYRALGVPPPPRSNTILLVYEYAGLSTLAKYAEPPLKRLSKLPPKKGFFGNVVNPDPLPSWEQRARYVVKGVLKQSLEAVAICHEGGIVHGSLGRASVLMTTTGRKSDKTEASSPYAIDVGGLVIKLSDFGFAAEMAEIGNDDEFRARARGFGMMETGGDDEGVVSSSSAAMTMGSIDATAFAIAEDLHALGFVFLGVLLGSLADIPDETYVLPKIDEDGLQRLLGEIFKGDMGELRDYLADEEAFEKVVVLLDDKDGAGWELLRSMCFAREDAVKNKGQLSLRTARGLLGSRFFE